MSGSLDGPRAKLARANSQGVALQRKIEAGWPPGKTWPVRTEANRSGLEYRFYLREVPSVDPDWILDLGEIMFNLRSALDHLAYELHVRRYRGRVPSKVDGVSQFPIYGTQADWKKNLYRIKNLSERDCRALRQYQPYITRRDEWQNHRVRLGDLNRLHNFDKHRKLHVVTGSLIAAYFPKGDFPLRCGFSSDPTWGAVKSGDQIDRWTFRAVPPEMHEHPGTTLEVAVEMGGDWWPLIRMLHGFTNTVRAVLDRFADRFK